MAVGFRIRKREYYDSVFLMGINKRLGESPGVEQSAVLMGTEANKRLLEEMGVSDVEIEKAAPNDLIVAVIAESESAVQAAIESLDDLLKAMTSGNKKTRIRTLNAALEMKPGANLAVFSIPGMYVGDEARRALEAGLNAFIFSSNVPVQQELELKLFARSKGLLVMGPDCGTSILQGAGIGFANQVRRGSIGVVGPSGTGLQEFTSQVHNAGSGISHAIGTGSRDLSDAIGGLTTLAALQMLQDDPGTEVIAIVAKPPGNETLQALLETATKHTKPVIGCFLGVEGISANGSAYMRWARTIDDAVDMALEAAGIDPAAADGARGGLAAASVASARSSWKPDAHFLRGVFAGGTLCYQTQQILRAAGLAVFSNSPLKTGYELADPDHSVDHTVVDMGDERYTLGKPHPMIDSTERARRIKAEAADPSVAVLLLDFILGRNAASDPVGDLLEVLVESQSAREQVGSSLTIVASLCGTDEDPQDQAQQAKMLRDIGVHVFGSNATATKFCVQLLDGRERER